MGKVLVSRDDKSIITAVDLTEGRLVVAASSLMIWSINKSKGLFLLLCQWLFGDSVVDYSPLVEDKVVEINSASPITAVKLSGQFVIVGAAPCRHFNLSVSSSSSHQGLENGVLSTYNPTTGDVLSSLKIGPMDEDMVREVVSLPFSLHFSCRHCGIYRLRRMTRLHHRVAVARTAAMRLPRKVASASARSTRRQACRCHHRRHRPRGPWAALVAMILSHRPLIVRSLRRALASLTTSSHRVALALASSPCR